MISEACQTEQVDNALPRVGVPGHARAVQFKLVEAASEHWRYLNAAHLVALVRVGAKFEKGALIERPDEAVTKVVA